MEHKEKIDLIYGLTEKLMKSTHDFLKKNELLNKDDVYCMLEAVSFFICLFTHDIFKKDTDIKKLNKFIDAFCKDTKDKLKFALNQLN